MTRASQSRTPQPPAVGRRTPAVGWLLIAAVAAACSAARPAGPDPRDTVQRYAAAVERGDADAAYDELSAAQQTRWSRDAFRAHFQKNLEELREEAGRLKAAVGTGAAELRHVYEVGDARATVAQQADGRWRLEAPFLPGAAPGGPRALVEALAAALLSPEWGALAGRLLTRERHDQLLAFGSALSRAALDVPVHSDAPSLRVPVPGFGTLVLTRQPPDWRVSAIEL